MLFERKDPLEKAIWLDGFFQAFAQVAQQIDEMPYATLKQIKGTIDPKTELAKSFASHHPFESRKIIMVNDSIRIAEGDFGLADIEVVDDLKKSLREALNGWLFIFLGLWNKQTTEVSFADPMMKFDISDDANKRKLVGELVEEICQVFDHTETSEIYSASSATGIRFLAVGKLTNWLLVFS